jgi:hypothetical protein
MTPNKPFVNIEYLGAELRIYTTDMEELQKAI